MRSSDGTSHGETALIWDEDCGFCARTVRLVPRLRLDADVVAWQQADLPALGLGEEACRRAVQWVGTDSASVEGGRAVAAALSASPTRLASARWAASLPGVRAVVDAAYRVVAANRHRLPGSTPACDVTASDGCRAPWPRIESAWFRTRLAQCHLRALGFRPRGRSSRSSRRGLRPTRSTGARMSDSSPSRWRAAALGATTRCRGPGCFPRRTSASTPSTMRDAAAFGSSPCTRHAGDGRPCARRPTPRLHLGAHAYGSAARSGDTFGHAA